MKFFILSSNDKSETLFQMLDIMILIYQIYLLIKKISNLFNIKGLILNQNRSNRTLLTLHNVGQGHKSKK